MTGAPGPASAPTPGLEVRDWGRVDYAEAAERQRELVAQRVAREIPDQLIFVEHPHVVTLGRGAHEENLLVSREHMASLGIALHETNRGGDVTYHGPGQIVGYPIVDLRDWKRDVLAYLRAVEQALMQTLGRLGFEAERAEGMTGVWVDGAKVAAIGVHVSRWVTSHGFALNHTTDLRYFEYIVPCGLTKPVTSLETLYSTHEDLGPMPDAGRVRELLAQEFASVLGRDLNRAGARESGEIHDG